jgi:hypothetical protein
MVLIVLVSLLQFGSAAVLEAGTTRTQQAEPAGIDVAQTVKALRKIKTDNSLDTTIPPAARPLLTTLKHQLRDLISRTLDSHGGQSAQLDNVRAALVLELQKQGVAFEKPKWIVIDKNYVDNGYVYGDIWGVTVQNMPDDPNLVAATTTIGVCCGQDTSFYLFRRSGRQYHLVIAQESNDYDEVSGAQGNFHYAVSPLSSTGRFFVVTSNVNPWCSSNFQGIRYKVLREGASPYEPKVLFERHEPIYIGNGNFGAIQIVPDGFRIEFEVVQRLDINVFKRKHIAAYRVEGGRVWRVPPFAESPDGFLDEWIDMSWEDAQKWIEPSEVDDLSLWHERLRTNPYGTEFVYEPPACEVEKGLWEVGIEFTPDPRGGSLLFGMPEKIYFTVALKDGAYSLRNVSSTSTASKCNSAGTSP